MSQLLKVNIAFVLRIQCSKYVLSITHANLHYFVFIKIFNHDFQGNFLKHFGRCEVFEPGVDFERECLSVALVKFGESWVLKGLVDCDAVIWAYYQHLTNQILRLTRNIVPFLILKIVLAPQYFPKNALVIFPPKWRFP